MEIFIIGAGTLGKFIIDIVESDKQYKISGFFDDGYPDTSSVDGYEIIGKISDIQKNRVNNLVIGIGEPKYRKKIIEEKSVLGYNFASVVHESVFVSKRCSIEDGVIIGPNSSVLAGSTIKRGACILSHVNINQNVTVCPYCLIGAGAIIGNNVQLGEGCHIGLASHIKLNQIIEPWTYYSSCS